MRSLDSLSAQSVLECDGRSYSYFSLAAAEANGAGEISRLPRSLRVLLENLLRHEDGITVRRDDLLRFASWHEDRGSEQEIAYYPSRILMNDSGGLPCMADLAALRTAIAQNGGGPEQINPLIPADMVVDHSVMVDFFGSPDAYERNLDLEYVRNSERYRFLRWCQQAFDNFRVMPPGAGICHQVNLEFLSRGVWTAQNDDRTWVFPETLLGTDSHTPMINALGILGWGVGGIEAAAALLGQPVTMMVPRVIGCRLTGALPAGTTATDLVLTITQRLREHGVVGTFVEFFGHGLADLPLADRATIANMAPEYGATMGFFPIDAETIRYLEATGRGGHNAALAQQHAQIQGLWHDPLESPPDFSAVVDIDLATIEPSMAGPRRPQDRLNLRDVPASVPVSSHAESGPADVEVRNDNDMWLSDGDVVIAAITSCTNTSNPAVMLGAGLLAKNAVERGLSAKPWVKTSLAPGSRVVADYLASTGLQPYLDRLGFNLVGFGCTTCMGNSGDLLPEVTQAVENSGLTAVAVLSGNRNFEGRIHPLAKANYIGSPLLVVAYALAGTARIDLTREPIGTDREGRPVHLSEIWPTSRDVAALMSHVDDPERFRAGYRDAFDGDGRWKDLGVPQGSLFDWPDDSLYMKEPPFLENFTLEPPPVDNIAGARVLCLLGDSITTDHISPVGIITPRSAAGQYLIDQGVRPADFNSFAARRINHEVMIRGTFANIRLRNEMAPDKEGGWTRYMPSGEVLPVHGAAECYRRDQVPLVVVAGAEYGTGSSRDWAAKGTRLLGVRAVIAEGLERIHRSNLIGMGILPLQFPPGVTRTTLGLDGSEVFDIYGLEDGLRPRMDVACKITRSDGEATPLTLRCRLDTGLEVEYFRHGGILQYVLRSQLGVA